MRHGFPVTCTAAAYQPANVPGGHECGPCGPQVRQQPASKVLGNSISPTSRTEAVKGEPVLCIEDRGAQTVTARTACCIINATLITGINLGRKQEVPDKIRDPRMWSGKMPNRFRSRFYRNFPDFFPDFEFS